MGVLNRCIAYQLASLYVVNVGRSLWDRVQGVVTLRLRFLDLLNTDLPKLSTYFFTFVLARAGITVPLYLLRPWMIPFMWSTDAVSYCDFAVEAAISTLVFVIGLTYSLIAPAILPACLLYFTVAGMAYRWLFAVAYEQEFDGCGAIWYDLFNGVMIGMFFGTLALIGGISVRLEATTVQILCTLPLPCALGFFYNFCYNRLDGALRHLSLEDAVAMDASVFTEVNPQLYVDPFFHIASTFHISPRSFHDRRSSGYAETVSELSVRDFSRSVSGGTLPRPIGYQFRITS